MHCKKSSVLAEVQSRVPDIFTFSLLAYGHPSKLRYGHYIFSLTEGVQQGDPMRCFLFCPKLQSQLGDIDSDFEFSNRMTERIVSHSLAC